MSAAPYCPGVDRLTRRPTELGGKTPMIVCDDADLDTAVPVLTAANTTFAGQFCMAGSRILVQRGIADALRTRMTAALDAVVVGPGDELATTMGPVIDRAAAQRVDALVADASAYGTVLVRGGLRRRRGCGPRRTPAPNRCRTAPAESGGQGWRVRHGPGDSLGASSRPGAGSGIAMGGAVRMSSADHTQPPSPFRDSCRYLQVAGPAVAVRPFRASPSPAMGAKSISHTVDLDGASGSNLLMT
ncbi:aldehyde dehydrogenase family protein [Streptomyces sp. NPDC048436]|uniref:aldehyde dehydrogenase family protein n=1 Tax=Streptomyces sp. NPDC048436 TaxID=3365550 RepID=UPI00371B21D9